MVTKESLSVGLGRSMLHTTDSDNLKLYPQEKVTLSN